MTRTEIYNRMKDLGIKHYIVSVCHMNEDGKRYWNRENGFHKCHYTDESFEQEIAYLESQKYNWFDVIHLHS